jgi:hypothetical protein
MEATIVDRVLLTSMPAMLVLLMRLGRVNTGMTFQQIHNLYCFEVMQNLQVILCKLINCSVPS